MIHQYEMGILVMYFFYSGVYNNTAIRILGEVTAGLALKVIQNGAM